jgi:hypothetical protein
MKDDPVHTSNLEYNPMSTQELAGAVTKYFMI